LDEDDTMTLAHLYDQLAPHLPSYARKDVQTAVRVLAKALHCSDPHHCSPDHYHQPLPTLLRLVEDSLRADGKGPHTIRNTKNYLSRLFRLAEDHHLLALAPVVLTPRYDLKQRSLRPGSAVTRHNGSHLPYAQWPPALQAAFTAFEQWATAPVVPGRPAQLRKRLSTIKDYRTIFQSYFGYLHHVAKRVPTFDTLFDYDLVDAYVRWHVNDLHQRPTPAIRSFLKKILALTHQYRPNEELRTKVRALQRTIPLPPPHYDKADAWLSLATLKEVGLALYPRKQPHELRYGHRKDRQQPGTYFAIRAGISLMLQLWTYIPYRQRNMREMKLEENLRKVDGHWRITFRGDQLKVGSKRGKMNVLDLPFPPQLVPVLEDYLTIWRPILLAKADYADTHVFLTQYGTPYRHPILIQTAANIIYRYTGKRWHPHMIRTIWATEMILKGVDFLRVAKMLNDDVKTVIANYAHLLDQNVAEEVYDLIDRDIA
jgi:Phage integrase family